MKYFIDTEFIEDFHKPLFGKRRHFIDLISIGIVAEDGREYYAISNEFNPKDASQWVRDNVISKLPLKLKPKESLGQFRDRCKLDSNYSGKWYDGKSNKMIAEDIMRFVLNGEIEYRMGIGNPPQPICDFYAYYGDYDWVVFCSLFGRMIDLPKGFPMYCHDLKQMLDDKAQNTIMQVEMKHLNETRFETSLRHLKSDPNYPKQTNEHDALSDARWNKTLYDFLNPKPQFDKLKSFNQ